jgi:Voltage-dependent anion channel
MRPLAELPAPVARILGAASPTSGAIVMGTGIVSIGLALDGQVLLSRILLVLCAIAWVTLAVGLGLRASRDRAQVRREAFSPAALTAVAGTEVLGSRLTLLGWEGAGIALLGIAFALWLALLGPVLGHLIVPTVGASLLVAVATESLAVLSAALATAEHTRWLVLVALAALSLGLAFYALLISRFDFRQLWIGRGDHWITGGALAISTLAAARIALACRSLHEFAGGAGALKVLTIVLWVLSIAWVPVLLMAELMHPRLGYDVRRWATVFPIGMYAACSFLAGAASHVAAITDFARIAVWPGVALWMIVFAAMLLRGLRLLTR